MAGVQNLGLGWRQPSRTHKRPGMAPFGTGFSLRGSGMGGKQQQDGENIGRFFDWAECTVIHSGSLVVSLERRLQQTGDGWDASALGATRAISIACDGFHDDWRLIPGAEFFSGLLFQRSCFTPGAGKGKYSFLNVR